MRDLTSYFVRLVAIAMAAGLFVPARVSAQSANGAPWPGPLRVGRILGVFDESGRPLEGAEILDRIGGGSLRTTRSGLVGMANARHATALEGVTITATKTAQLPFYLKDFGERLESAKGTGAKAFTPEEFRKKDGRHLYDVLREKHVGDRTARCGRILSP